MAICKNCGVDLGEGNDKCPLCDIKEEPGKIGSPADLLNFSKKENRKQLYELAMVLFASAIVITIAINAVFGRGNWSMLTTTCIGYVMAIITILNFAKRHPYWLIGGSMTATLLLLFLLDMLTGNKGWFASVAGPVTASFAILSGAVIFFNSLSKYKGLNLIASILIAFAIFVLVIEYFTDRFISDIFNPQWSIVAAASLIILASILIFVHYRLKRGRSLGRLFHI